jgi:hypothetical protein
MPLMSPPYVTGVTFKNSRIVLTIRVDNFQPGESLEISGQATQNGGGYAAFYDNKCVVPKPNPDGTAYIYVEATPSQAFENSSNITVVLRAAKVWVTVLGESPPESRPVGHAAPVDDGSTWGYIQAMWPPDDDEASAGNEASFPDK